MFPTSVKRTSLWKSTLCESIDDEYKYERERLRVALDKLRDNAEVLVNQIGRTLPELTQHDISHLDALWETASIICGENYPLNPLEAFVLGGAILLHDSALCFEAFEEGQDGLRSTIVWKDYFAQLKDSQSTLGKTEVQNQADFATLRTLHAVQAENLGHKSWLNPQTGNAVYLIEDTQLRNHLGKLIGQIAGSHHWNIDDLSQNLRSQVNAIAVFPREWNIDPIKLACILRCADASHIDNRRAPDFLHALIKRSGISLNHWLAQNKLSQVDLDNDDPSNTTLLFTSTDSFSENESEAWWVAYDAICLVDKEIRDSNALLESRNKPQSPPFPVKRVRGVESPELMMHHIETNEWNPCVAEIHVGNIQGLIRSLGGEQLYGANRDNLEVVLRELIQNARDSIDARRNLEPDNYQGKINIKLHEEQDNRWITIEDNGVGMSKKVLTGPLLDFGTSFWTSTLAQSELPGLRSSGFKSVGKFGIGFYSVFMSAEHVEVASRPWKRGISDVWQIQFKHGLSLRPILKNTPPDDFPPNFSTQIKIRLKDESFCLSSVEIKRNTTADKTNLKVDFSDYLSAICSGLDVDVSLTAVDGQQFLIHKANIEEMDFSDWLNTIAFSKYQDEKVSAYIYQHSNRLRAITEDGKQYGIAALSTLNDNSQNFLSVRTVGGLASTVHGRSGSNYLGYIDYLPKSAKREGETFSASTSTMKSWAEEQKEILKQTQMSDVEAYFAGSNLCHFEVDPLDIVKILVNINGQYWFLKIKELAKTSKTIPIAFFKSDVISNHIETHHNIDKLDGYALIKPLANGSFLNLEMDGDNQPKNPNSILGCLIRAIQEQGDKPKIEVIDQKIQSHFGYMNILKVEAISEN